MRSVAAFAIGAFSIWMLYLVYQAVRSGETRVHRFGHLTRELDPQSFYLIAGARLFVGLLGLTAAAILAFG